MRITGIRFLSYHFSLCFLETNFRNYRNFLVIIIMDKLRALRQFVSLKLIRFLINHYFLCSY